jgi:carbon monoxide dehydrogenase subunit G
VKIAGEYTIPVPEERAYLVLQDPELLARAMPGCQTLERIGDGEYHMKMKLVLASMSGLFEGKVRVTDQDPFSRFRLIVEGTGKIGFVKGEGLLTLTAVDGGTSVHYDGGVEMGGTIATVGQRLLDTTARMLIKSFFKKLIADVAHVKAADSATDDYRNDGRTAV